MARYSRWSHGFHSSSTSNSGIKGAKSNLWGLEEKDRGAVRDRASNKKRKTTFVKSDSRWEGFQVYRASIRGDFGSGSAIETRAYLTIKSYSRNCHSKQTRDALHSDCSLVRFKPKQNRPRVDERNQRGLTTQRQSAYSTDTKLKVSLMNSRRPPMNTRNRRLLSFTLLLRYKVSICSNHSLIIGECRIGRGVSMECSNCIGGRAGGVTRIRRVFFRSVFVLSQVSFVLISHSLPYSMILSIVVFSRSAFSTFNANWNHLDQSLAILFHCFPRSHASRQIGFILVQSLSMSLDRQRFDRIRGLFGPSAPPFPLPLPYSSLPFSSLASSRPQVFPANAICATTTPPPGSASPLSFSFAFEISHSSR